MVRWHRYVETASGRYQLNDQITRIRTQSDYTKIDMHPAQIHSPLTVADFLLNGYCDQQIRADSVLNLEQIFILLQNFKCNSCLTQAHVTEAGSNRLQRKGQSASIFVAHVIDGKSI